MFFGYVFLSYPIGYRSGEDGDVSRAYKYMEVNGSLRVDLHRVHRSEQRGEVFSVGGHHDVDALAVGVVVFVNDASVQCIQLGLIQLVVYALTTPLSVAIDQHSREYCMKKRGISRAEKRLYSSIGTR